MSTFSKNDSLTSLLNRGTVEFMYHKLDGTTRCAKGTLSPKLFTYTASTTGTRKPNPGVYTYWDLDKQQFRCFKKEYYIGVTSFVEA